MEELVKAVEQIRASRSYLSHQLATEIVFQGKRSRPDPLSNFKKRKIEVLTLLAQGKRYALIAEELGVSYKTVINMLRVRHRGSSAVEIRYDKTPRLTDKSMEMINQSYKNSKTGDSF